MDQDLPKQAAEKGEYFMQRLRAIADPRIREIRGLGLMIGIELKQKAGPIAQAMLKEGVLVLLAGTTVLRFLPPLVITRQEIDTVIFALTKVLATAPGATAE
ncbi:MAG: aminotransferase class III-fold pyridoxal phosphate-dependent enzyme [Candidatus Methylomirabilales bacterium]